MENRKGFCTWMRRLRAAMIKAGCGTAQQVERYGGPEDWRLYFDSGYSPTEALLEDFSYQ